MGRGEVAKFAAAAVREDAAGVREDAATAAERDWRTMRAWVDASGQAPAFARKRAEIAAARESGAGAAGIEPDRDGPAEVAVVDPDATRSTGDPE
jgi:hypothetical protein